MTPTGSHSRVHSTFAQMNPIHKHPHRKTPPLVKVFSDTYHYEKILNPKLRRGHIGLSPETSYDERSEHMGNKNSGRHKLEEIPFVEEVKSSPQGGRPVRSDMNRETGKNGRPRKGEVVVKPFIGKRRSNIKPENQLKYAEDAIKRAEKLYMKYQREFPNPLNLDVKKIAPEAKTAWEYVFSLRGYTAEDAGKMKYRTIENSEEVLVMFEAFCGYIRDNNFAKYFTRPDGTPGMLPIVPNMTNFARWLGISTRPIRKVMDVDLAAKEEYKTMLSDLLSEGAMVGAYTSASAIFTLKNLCDWADNPEDRGIKQKKEFVPVEEAEKALAALGYTRPKLLE